MSYCNKCRVHGHSITNCRKVKSPNRSQGIERHREKDSQSKSNGDVIDITQNGKDKSVVTANPPKVTEDGPWQMVTHKKKTHKAARGVYVQKEPPSDPGNVASEADKSNSDVIVKDPTLNLESAGDQEITPINDNFAKTGEDGGSYVLPSEPGVEEEDPAPSIGDSNQQVPGSGVGEPLEHQPTAEVYYNEILQSHVHPAGEAHYLNIVSKIGSASNSTGEVSYVTKRSKNKVNKGGKHCPSPLSQ